MALPLTHRVDHTPVVILPDDSAWDQDRIDREQDQIAAAKKNQALAAECPWPSLRDHPTFRYHAGLSRFDATTVQQYLMPDEEPVRFTLRRLPDDPHWIRILHLQEQGRLAEGRRYAVKHGLVEVSGLEHAFAIKANEPLDADQIEQLKKRIGDEGMQILGDAIVAVSRELLDAEKKR
jgi:hypothetical protein